jgi:hypothetical protein
LWQEFNGWRMPELLTVALTYSQALLDLKQESKAQEYIQGVLTSVPEEELRANGNTDQLKVREGCREGCT